MQEHIKRLAVEAGFIGRAAFNHEAELTAFAQAVARECVQICLAEGHLGLDDERAYNGKLMAQAICNKFGLE